MMIFRPHFLFIKVICDKNTQYYKAYCNQINILRFDRNQKIEIGTSK